MIEDQEGCTSVSALVLKPHPPLSKEFLKSSCIQLALQRRLAAIQAKKVEKKRLIPPDEKTECAHATIEDVDKSPQSSQIHASGLSV